MGSFGSGLLRIKNYEPNQRYTNSNSSLKNSVGTNEVVSGMAYDSKNNLWVSNYETDRPLAVMRANGSWSDFNVGTKRLGEMIIDQSDYCLTQKYLHYLLILNATLFSESLY